MHGGSLDTVQVLSPRFLIVSYRGYATLAPDLVMRRANYSSTLARKTICPSSVRWLSTLEEGSTGAANPLPSPAPARS